MTRMTKIVYWISTLWLSLGMLSSAIAQLVKIEQVVESFTHLGYPLYLLNILAAWKILGVFAVLAPKSPLLKEWAYAGFFFLTTGALISHIASADSFGDTFPAILLLCLTVVSWYFRPAGRRLSSDEK